MDLNQVTLPARNVDESVAFYLKMGFELVVETPHYARFRATAGHSTFSVQSVEQMAHAPRTVVYFECSGLDRQVDELRARGLLFAQEPRNEEWLWREARIVDPSGNVICLYHAGKNRVNPP